MTMSLPILSKSLSIGKSKYGLKILRSISVLIPLLSLNINVSTVLLWFIISYNILVESKSNDLSWNLMDNLGSLSKLSSNSDLTKFESIVVIIILFKI